MTGPEFFPASASPEAELIVFSVMLAMGLVSAVGTAAAFAFVLYAFEKGLSKRN